MPHLNINKYTRGVVACQLNPHVSEPNWCTGVTARSQISMLEHKRLVTPPPLPLPRLKCLAPLVGKILAPAARAITNRNRSSRGLEYMQEFCIFPSDSASIWCLVTRLCAPFARFSPTFAGVLLPVGFVSALKCDRIVQLHLDIPSLSLCNRPRRSAALLL